MPEGLPARVSRLSVRAVHRLLVSALIAFWLWRDAKIKAAMDQFLFLLEGSARDRRTGLSLEP